MKIFNTLTRTKEELKTVEEGKVMKDGAVWRLLRKAVVAFEN